MRIWPRCLRRASNPSDNRVSDIAVAERGLFDRNAAAVALGSVGEPLLYRRHLREVKLERLGPWLGLGSFLLRGGPTRRPGALAYSMISNS